MTKRKINSLYIHIPFCKNICPYCDFVKLLKNKQFEDKYISMLLKDLSQVEDKFFKFKTIYIGGGTPSSLSIQNLDSLLKKLDSMHLLNDYEFTIEANPEDISDEFLKIISKYKVNRISIGVQTFDKKILASISRNYSIDFKKLISKVKEVVPNINLDFIYGLPNYNVEVLKMDLSDFFELNVEHASFYSLIVSPGTIYYNKGIKECDSSISRDYYDLILDEMRKHGYKRYEVSNFAKNGFESKHNLTYWHNEEYVAVGLGSSGYVNGIRYVNTNNFSEYINGYNEIKKEQVTNDLLKEYYFITNLRLEDGFDLVEYKKIFKEDFSFAYKNKIVELTKNGLVKLTSNKFCCTDEGIMLLDEVLLKLIS